MTTKLPELLPDDYKDKDAQFWKEYREILYEQIKEKEREKKLEKTPENIYYQAMENSFQKIVFCKRDEI